MSKTLTTTDTAERQELLRQFNTKRGRALISKMSDSQCKEALEIKQTGFWKIEALYENVTGHEDHTEEFDDYFDEDQYIEEDFEPFDDDYNNY